MPKSKTPRFKLRRLFCCAFDRSSKKASVHRSLESTSALPAKLLQGDHSPRRDCGAPKVDLSDFSSEDWLAEDVRAENFGFALNRDPDISGKGPQFPNLRVLEIVRENDSERGATYFPVRRC